MKSTGTRRAPRLELVVQRAPGVEGLPDGRHIRRWVRAAACGPARVTVRFVDAAESRALNRHFRGIDRATNVLSFGYATQPVLEGDLAVCMPVAARESVRRGRTLEAHLAHLVVHGILHLAGYDHEHEQDAGRMEAKERELLARLGFPQP